MGKDFFVTPAKYPHQFHIFPAFILFYLPLFVVTPGDQFFALHKLLVLGRTTMVNFGRVVSLNQKEEFNSGRNREHAPNS